MFIVPLSICAGHIVGICRYNHLISGMSMIAPSPDWIVGIDSIPVCKGSEWLDRIEYDAHLWDAGTDSGLRFTSRNQATNPREIIQRIRYACVDVVQTEVFIQVATAQLYICMLW